MPEATPTENLKNSIQSGARRILVVDDDSSVCESICRQLRTIGFDPIYTIDSKEALALYRRERPSAVVLDIVMPERDGLDTLIDLRKKFPDAKVLVMSGHPRFLAVDSLQWATKLGAQRTLLKPFTFHELNSALQEILGS